jgi:5-methyltetrahydropteroyltriglutamate--homocysteine methyltransferase
MAGVAERHIAAGQVLMPGVVSHATNLVEHPQLVADRIHRSRLARDIGLDEASQQCEDHQLTFNR